MPYSFSTLLDKPTLCGADVVVLAVTVSASIAAEQPFPSKPVRIVVPFPAGGSFDVTAQILAPCIQSDLGETIIVENRPGGGTVVDTDYVVRQPPDGHTMLMTCVNFTSHAVLRSPLNFDTDRYRRIIREANVRME